MVKIIWQQHLLWPLVVRGLRKLNWLVLQKEISCGKRTWIPVHSLTQKAKDASSWFCIKGNHCKLDLLICSSVPQHRQACMKVEFHADVIWQPVESTTKKKVVVGRLVGKEASSKKSFTIRKSHVFLFICYSDSLVSYKAFVCNVVFLPVQGILGGKYWTSGPELQRMWKNGSLLLMYLKVHKSKWIRALHFCAVHKTTQC
jgi:hypothetical protein